MGFTSKWGVMFPVVVFKAALSLVLLKETAWSVFSLLLGRGRQHPVPAIMMGSDDWEGDLSSFNSRLSGSLVQDVMSFLAAVRYEDVRGSFGEEHQCSVCLSDFDAMQEVVQLPHCPHVFHRDCLGKWLGHGHSTCPLCRASVTSEGFLEKRGYEMEVDEEFMVDSALWMSMHHPEGARGFWWQSCIHGFPYMLGGVH